MSDTKISLVISWLIISAVIAFILITSAIYPSAPSIRFLPTSLCKINSHCSCPVCGMTRAFVSIAHGRISDARSFNGLALPLFIVFVLNKITVVLFIYSHYSRSFLQGFEKGITNIVKRKVLK